MPEYGQAAEEVEFIPTRQSLLSRLKNWNDQESWREFFDTYWQLIYRLARRGGLTDAEAQDVVQETMLSAAKAMPGFKYDPAVGSFKNWLSHLIRWRITDQLRKRICAESGEPHPDDSHRTSTLERLPDPRGLALEAIWDEEWRGNLLRVALERVKRRVSPRQYQMYDFCVVQQWPVQTVARTLRVSAGRVYLAKHRISALVKREINRLKTKML